jgi:hypothetical protein
VNAYELGRLNGTKLVNGVTSASIPGAGSVNPPVLANVEYGLITPALPI